MCGPGGTVALAVLVLELVSGEEKEAKEDIFVLGRRLPGPCLIEILTLGGVNRIILKCSDRSG